MRRELRRGGVAVAALVLSMTLARGARAQPDQPLPPEPPPPEPTAPEPEPGQPLQPIPPPPENAPPPQGPPPYGPPPYGPPPYGQPGYYPPPPGYYPPPGFYPTGPPPAKLPYEDGDPIPPGYVVETGVKKGLVIAGATTLGPLWIISIVAGAILIDANEEDAAVPLFIPVVGPFVAIGTVEDGGATSGVLLAFNGLGQTAGLAMLITGLVLENQWLRYRGGETPGPYGAFELTPKMEVGADGARLGMEATF